MSISASIDRDIFQHQLTGIAEEMSQALLRSSHSPIIWDMYDYACAIFSPGGELIAQAETITAQLGTMSTALEAMKRAIPLQTWKPGDVLICNDPYRGCTHTPDITIFSPVICDGELIAITSTIAHHTDIGGRYPLTTSIDNPETFAEGLIFPQIRFHDQGRPNETAIAFIVSNVRDPRAVLGDLRAQIAGCHVAERRLGELAHKYGVRRFRQMSDALLDYGEDYVRAVIGAWPDGTYTAEVRLENGVTAPEDLLVRAAITVSGEKLHIDFTGSSGQIPCALNCPWSSTVSLATYAVKCLTAPDIPHNEGFNRVITLTAPEGSIVNPRRPAAVGSRVRVQQAIADAVLKALGGLVPQHAAAGSQISFPVFKASGVDDRNGGERTYRIMDIIGGGMGAHDAGDGIDAVDTHGANCAILSAEVMELMSPIRVVASRLVPNSGGAGKYRGGLAIEREYELLATEATFSCGCQQTKAVTAAWGLAGGKPGGYAEAFLRTPGQSGEINLLPRNSHRPFLKGQIARMRASGGGGWGKPSDRATELVKRDRVEGYVE
jgi:N-methylhydantoinase B